MVLDKVCKDCGKSVEDVPEKILFLVIDERRRETCICQECVVKRMVK